MIRITASVLMILTMFALLWFAYILPKDQRLTQWLVMITILGVAIAAIFFGLLKSVRDTFVGSLFAFATIWSSWKMIESIDFDKPFFLSFYWSTLSFLLLTLFCLLLTIGSFVSAAHKSQ